MNIYTKNIFVTLLLVSLTAPGLVSYGMSHFPIWAPFLLLFSLNYNVKYSNIYILASSVIYYCLSFVFQNHLFDIPGNIIFYHFSMFSLIILVFTSRYTIDIAILNIICLIACIINFLLVLLELNFDGFCQTIGFLKQVRECSEGRPAGLYAEPSHIAFLALTLLIISQINNKLSYLQKTLYISIALLTGLIAFSFTFIVGLFFILFYNIFKRARFLNAFFFLSILWFLINLLYLFLRLYYFLPSNQSYDKRSLFLVYSILNVGVFPSVEFIFLESKFYLSNDIFSRIVFENPEIDVTDSFRQVYNMSVLGGLLSYAGLVGFYYVIRSINCSNRSSFHALILCILWLGLPASLAVFLF